MTELTITDADRKDAEAFLTRFLSDLYPDADFSAGSVTRDHTIGALSAIYALLRGEADSIRAATSLRTVGLLEDEDDFDEAVDNLVANWFISRRTGRAVRGTALIHFAEQHDGYVPATTTFTKQAGLRYLLDSDGPVTYAATDLTPRTDATGEVIDYTLRVPVVAASVGTQYEVEAGPFSHVDRFNTHVLFAENDNAYSGARDAETSEELLERLPTAITVRDLNSVRAIETVLKEEFSAIDDVVVFGYGDKGMRRDLAQLMNGVEVHLGGHMDVFVATPIAERRVFEGTVGGLFTDARQDITLFRDDTIADWRAEHIQVGDVLRIHNAEASESDLYIIDQVTKYFLRISPKQAFPSVRPTILRDEEAFTDGSITSSNELQSTDANFSELDVGRWIRVANSGSGNDGDYKIISVDPSTNTVTLDTSALTTETAPPMTFQILEGVVEYTIGDTAPAYDNKVSISTTGEFSRQYQADGKVLLPQEPIYLIREVSILDKADPDTDPISGRVQFPNRVNDSPEALSGSDLQYRVENLTPLTAQSAQHMMVLDVGYAVELSGNNAEFDGSNQIYLPAPATLDASDDVGKTIRILDAVHDVNRGEFTIDTVVQTGDGQTLDAIALVTDPDDNSFSSTSETRLQWELVYNQKYNTKPLRVVYDTINQFDVVHTYVMDDANRVACANTLVRGLHPVYLSFELTYALRENAPDNFNTDNAKQELVNYINEFPATDVIHASDIVSFFQSTNSAYVGYVEMPLTIDYDLLSPDGRSIPYQTQDAVELDPVRLALSTPEDRLEDALEIGVVDENVRYLTTLDLVTLTQVT